MVAREVAPDPAPEIGGLADVEHRARGVLPDIDPGAVREGVELAGERLGRGRGGHRWEMYRRGPCSGTHGPPGHPEGSHPHPALLAARFSRSRAFATPRRLVPARYTTPKSPSTTTAVGIGPSRPPSQSSTPHPPAAAARAGAQRRATNPAESRVTPIRRSRPRLRSRTTPQPATPAPAVRPAAPSARGRPSSPGR